MKPDPSKLQDYWLQGLKTRGPYAASENLVPVTVPHAALIAGSACLSLLLTPNVPLLTCQLRRRSLGHEGPKAAPGARSRASTVRRARSNPIRSSGGACRFTIFLALQLPSPWPPWTPLVFSASKITQTLVLLTVHVDGHLQVPVSDSPA